MAKLVLKNVRLFAGGADLTTYSNKVELASEAEEKEATAFTATGDPWKEVLAGIRSMSLSGSGQWDAAANAPGPLLPDDASFDFLGAVQAVTVCPDTATDGSLAWLSGALRQDYQLGGAVGDVAPWSGKWSGNWPLARGLVTAGPTARTATGTSTIVNIPGGVPAGKFLIGTVHAFSFAGTSPSISAAVMQSAAAIGFASPTTRLTFSAATAPGGQVFRVAGPITDAYFRLSYTITGTGPSIVFASAVGVG